MEFTPVPHLQISITSDPANTTQLPKILQLGQRVTATVISPTSEGQSLVKINGEILKVVVDKLLAAGESLNLKVTQLPTAPLAKALNVPIQQVTQAQSALLLSAPEPVLKNWQAGSVLQALIVDQKPNGQTLLDISGSLIQADAAQVFRRGQPIAIQISNLANPVLARIVAEAAAETAPGSSISRQTATPQVGLNMAISPGVRLQLPATLLDHVQTGQQFDTRVSTAMRNGKAVLNINGTSVNVQTTLPLSQGQRLSLQITELGKPAILVPADAVNTDKLNANTVAQAMRQLLPLQSGLPEMLGSVSALAQPVTQMSTALDRVNPTAGEQLRFLAQQILQQLPRASEAGSAAGLKSALRQSGVFLESQLANAVTQQNASQLNPLPDKDLKANLLRLFAFLQRTVTTPGQAAASSSSKMADNSTTQDISRIPQPPLRDSQPQAQARASAAIAQQLNAQAMLNDLLRQVSGSLARIQLHQLASIGTDDEPRHVQITEVPIHHNQGADVFQIRFEEDRHQKQKTKREKTWSVTLAFDIGKFGPVHVKLSLIKDVINTTFWAEQSETKQLIDSHLEILHKHYVAAGLGIGHMICHLGAPPQPIVSTTKASFIVDIQA